MDLTPYQRINPCGYPGLQTVDLRSLGVTADLAEVSALWEQQLISKLGS
jgi:lipoyl(octanoyl) transferase